MTQQDKDKGKNIFQSAVDAVSTRDEKEALAAAQKKLAEVEQRATRAEQLAAQNATKLSAAELRATQTAQKLTEAERQVTQLKADLSKAQSELTASRSTAATLSQKFAAVNAELQKHISADQAEKVAEAAASAAKAQVLAEHTIKPDETLSHLAAKYYGSAGEAYWRLIYEANKAVIGDNPGRVRPGMVLQIPVLPDSLKKK